MFRDVRRQDLVERLAGDRGHHRVHARDWIRADVLVADEIRRRRKDQQHLVGAADVSVSSSTFISPPRGIARSRDW